MNYTWAALPDKTANEYGFLLGFGSGGLRPGTHCYGEVFHGREARV